MTYNTDETWLTISNKLSSDSRNAIQHLEVGLRGYNEWQSFRAGRTNAQIAALTGFSRTEAEIADMDSAYAGLKAIHDYANNQTPVQGDYLYSLRKFS